MPKHPLAKVRRSLGPPTSHATWRVIEDGGRGGRTVPSGHRQLRASEGRRVGTRVGSLAGPRKICVVFAGPPLTLPGR